MSDLQSLVSELHGALERKQLDIANDLLSRAKRALLMQNALIPTSSTPPQLVVLARQVLELGALASIRQTDAQLFTRYYQQLQPFYDLERHAGLPGQNSSNVDFSTSQRSKITGLYLLLLLSMGDSANFHTVLEGLVEEASLQGGRVEDDAYIKYPVELERNLMEGSYDKVWRETKSERVPSEDFGLFSNVSCTRLDCMSNKSTDPPIFYRFSLALSAVKSQTARRRRILPSPSLTPKTSFSSSLKVPLSSSPNSVVGFSATAGYTSLSSLRRLPGPRRTSWWPAVPLLRTRWATPGNWRPLFNYTFNGNDMLYSGMNDLFGRGCTCIPVASAL